MQTPLWRAKIHPLRPIPSLSDEELAALGQALRDVLQDSIDAGGAPFELNLYGQRAAGTTPIYSIGKRARRVRPVVRRWPKSGRGARGATSAPGVSHLSHQTNVDRDWLQRSPND